MTKSQIIEQLFTGKNFNDCIRKMEPEHLQDDLRMEVIAIVCEWTEDKIVGLYARNELDFYVVRVILNQIKSSTSPFFKKYRQPSGDVVYDECGKGDFYTALEHYNRMPQYSEGRISAGITPSFLEEELQISERYEREANEDRAMQEIDNLYWYNAELLKLYGEGKSLREIQTATGIPHVSCYHTIRKSIKMIKEKLKA